MKNGHVRSDFLFPRSIFLPLAFVVVLKLKWNDNAKGKNLRGMKSDRNWRGVKGNVIGNRDQLPKMIGKEEQVYYFHYIFLLLSAHGSPTAPNIFLQPLVGGANYYMEKREPRPSLRQRGWKWCWEHRAENLRWPLKNKDSGNANHKIETRFSFSFTNEWENPLS